MVNYKLPETSVTFIFVVWVSVALGESQGAQPHLGAQQFITRDLGASEIALSLLVNQVTLLKLINESSTICSLHEKELQENRDLKMELDVKTEELKHELQDYMEAAVNKLKNKTTATITEMEVKNQEARDVLIEANETAVNMSRQGEKDLQDMRDLRLELDVKAEELNNDLLNMKNELENKAAASLAEINRLGEAAKHDLRVKETALNASLQQGENELQQLRNDLQQFKTTTTKEMQNLTAMINDIKTTNGETQQALNEVKETLESVTLLAARIAECEAGWSEYRRSCYKVFKTDVTYDVASESCRAHGAYLASIGSEGENSFVAGLVEGWTHIGLDDREEEGVFTWQDGSPFGYSKWSGTNPDGIEGQNCVQIHADSSWIDFYCNNIVHYICEKRLQ